jgi:hypothetical protein
MILVLNADYTPLTVMNQTRGFNLVYKGKAEVLVKKEPPISAGQIKFDRPSVIRLHKYVSFPYKKVTLSRYNVYRRDNFKCLYCGAKDNLTLDHVIPRSKGGPNSWTNLATCCMKCNVSKGDRTLEETGMTLSQKPFTPSYLFFIKKMNKVYEEWMPFLMTDK